MATRWARIQDGKVFELVLEDPTGLYHESLVFVEVEDDDVSEGWRYEDGVFSSPLPPVTDTGGAPGDPVEPTPEPEPEPVYRTAVSKVEYYGFFTPLEEAMIRLTASKTVTAEMVEAADAEERQKLLAVLVLRVMLDRVDKLASTQVIQLTDPQVTQGLGLCHQMGLLEEHRPAEITRGVLETNT